MERMTEELSSFSSLRIGQEEASELLRRQSQYQLQLTKFSNEIHFKFHQACRRSLIWSTPSTAQRTRSVSPVTGRRSRSIPLVQECIADGSILYQGRRYVPATSSPRLPAEFSFHVMKAVRFLLHQFLTDKDAARLLRVSPTTALSLVKGRVFTDHVFAPKNEEGMWATKALCDKYDIRPLNMCIPDDVEELNFDSDTGTSPFPSSLTSLLLGEAPRDNDGEINEHSLFGPKSARLDSIDCVWSRPHTSSDVEWYRELLFRRKHPVRFLKFARGSLSAPIPTGLLPHGLRRLQFPQNFDLPLQVGVIPSTVELLQFGGDYNQPLGVGVLPSALIHLVLGSFNQPLSAGVLPSSLQRLFMGEWDYPLTVGLLPASLKALDITRYNHPLLPDVFPSGLTHLFLDFIDQPLNVGVLPSSLVSFDIGEVFHYPLHPGVLPPSLRLFYHSSASHHPLVRGALPEGLELLRWRIEDEEIDLVPGVLPDSLRALDILRWTGRILPGAVSGDVRWVLIPREFEEDEEETVFAQTTQLLLV